MRAKAINSDDAFLRWGVGRLVAKCGGKGGKPGPCPSGRRAAKPAMKVRLSEPEQDIIDMWAMGGEHNHRWRMDEAAGKKTPELAAFNAVLDKMPVYRGYGFRGVDDTKGKYAELKPGDTFVMPSTSSYSKKADPAIEFIEGHPKAPVLWIAETKSGADISQNVPLGFDYQEEVLFRAGKKYKVWATEVQKDVPGSRIPVGTKIIRIREEGM